MDLDRIRRGSPAVLSVTFYGDDVPTSADGIVTYEVKNQNGTSVASGNASNASTGTYQFTLPAQANLAQLTVTWAGQFSGQAASVQTAVEIVAGDYFTVAELRNFDSVLTSTAKYPNDKLRDARTSAEVDFERICGRAFLPRYAKQTLSGDRSRNLWLSNPSFLRVISLTVDGEDWSDKTLYMEPDNLRVIRLADDYRWPCGDYNIVIEYEHGMDAVPFDIKRAAMKFARYKVVADQARIDERATVMNIPDFGTFSLATPGFRGSYTGIPDVDVVLREYELVGGAW